MKLLPFRCDERDKRGRIYVYRAVKVKRDPPKIWILIG